MKKVFSTSDPVIISHYKTILENQGIACILKNYYLTGAAGELPINTCWPELWIIDNSHYKEAKAILSKLDQPVSADYWTCPSCGEINEPEFGVCWQCGSY